MHRIAIAFLVSGSLLCAKARKHREPSALDRYIQEAMSAGAAPAAAAGSKGSLWSPAAPFGDLVADFRASQVNDMVTILVTEQASAVAKGTTKTARSSAASNSITNLAGPVKAGSALAGLVGLSGTTQLDGQGAITRDTVVSATLTARVTHVLPNGYLVLEGAKEIQVDSERQLLTVRGVVRPADVGPGNLVRSDRLAQLELRVNGKGVVGDAIHRPMILYRLLLGLLPF